ncbi:MAG: hypothetical protein LBJ96_01455 [Holosporaceae bacterium]|jgi:hypothetical protein|nr:hypothetical protein [Holosporaceae bacterium]
MKNNQCVNGLKILLSAVAILSTIESGNSVVTYTDPVTGETGLITNFRYSYSEENAVKDRIKFHYNRGAEGVWTAFHAAIGYDVKNHSGDMSMVKFLVEVLSAHVTLAEEKKGDRISPFDQAHNAGREDIVEYLRNAQRLESEERAQRPE